jgi:nicotinamidase-related amidase
MATAILCCDIQPDILGNITEAERERLLAETPVVLQKARNAGVHVVFIRVAFRPGYPEVSPRNLVRVRTWRILHLVQTFSWFLRRS